MKNQSNRAMVLGNVSQLPSNEGLELQTAASFREAIPGPCALFINGVARVAGSYGYRDRVDTPGDTLYSDVMAFDLRVDGIDPDGDATFPELLFAPPVAAINYLFNGTSFDRQASAGAATLAAEPTVGAQLVTEPGEWTEIVEPALAAVASVTKAAGAAGVRHVCKGIYANCSAAAGAGGPILFVRLRDGAAGAGTIIWTGTLTTAANTTAMINISGLNVIGSAATAMTLEFSAGPGAGGQQTVTLAGISVG